MYTLSGLIRCSISPASAQVGSGSITVGMGGRDGESYSLIWDKWK